MSDTPQTDEWSVDITCGVFGQTLLWKNSKGPFVSRRLAEKLERENAALRSLLREVITDHELLAGTCDAVETEDFIARVKTALGEEDKP